MYDSEQLSVKYYTYIIEESSNKASTRRTVYNDVHERTGISMGTAAKKKKKGGGGRDISRALSHVYLFTRRIGSAY